MVNTVVRTLVIVAAAALVTLFILSSSTRAIASEAAHAFKSDIDVPVKFNWYHAAHKPPEQSNSSRGDTSWHADFRWLNPFSGSVTLDEDRTLLPPPLERTCVYTYYDTTIKRDEQTKQVDKELIQIWRRAWWAKGFRPVVLTQAEALNNPMYRELAPKGMPKALEYEFARWMAWSHMGTGLLAETYCFPMAADDDAMFTHLRRGQFSSVTRFKDLGSGLFAGEKSQIDAAMKDALQDTRLSTYPSIIEAVKEDFFRVEDSSSLAYYDPETLQKRYPAIADSILSDRIAGRQDLNRLIITHLQITWQNRFNNGIEVLKPLPAHTTALVEPSLHLAELLAECHQSILPSSCPPNRPRCSPCVGSHMRITQPEAFRNASNLYTISTVPHPYTLLTLNNQSSTITVSHIRRNTDRDSWIRAATRNILGDGRGGPSRLIGLKDAVASPYSSSRSLWFTVEHFPTDLLSTPVPEDRVPTNDVQSAPAQPRSPFPENWLEHMDWYFGFPVPRTTKSHGESMNPVPASNRWGKGSMEAPADRKGSYDPADPNAQQKLTEQRLLKEARELIGEKKDKEIVKLRDVAEKWNLADLEVWKFVRAYRARSVLELETFLKEESAFEGSGGEGRKGGTWW